jgi:hypothetical protein
MTSTNESVPIHLKDFRAIALAWWKLFKFLWNR